MTGPVMVMMTTTAIELDEELMNRCVVLTVDDGREQTRAIHEKQREAQTIEGILARQERGGVMQLHQNAQRLLQPMLVANPFAHELRFRGPRDADAARPREVPDADQHDRAVHQHQRPVKRSSTAAARCGTSRSRAKTSRSPTGSRRRCSRARWMSLRRRRGGCSGVIDALVTEVAERAGHRPLDVRFTQRELRELVCARCDADQDAPSDARGA